MTRRTLFLVLPIAIFVLVSIGFYKGLYMDTETLPSALIGKPVPQFALAAPEGLGQKGFSTTDLKAGKVSLVNAFASWCLPCHAEHPLLMELSKTTDIPIYGLNVKDKPQDADGFLSATGDPYTAVGADSDGRVSIDFGVYGYPETFVVAGDGTILYRQVGPLTRDILKDTILPLVKAYQKTGTAEGSAAAPEAEQKRAAL
jgi:cytochrome c biogenesis protein CcmG/thiol:disulfide interchange protein DsbE